MLNITEKIQLSAEEFGKKFAWFNKESERNELYENTVEPVKDFLITSQKELAKSIVEEFVGEMKDIGMANPPSTYDYTDAGYNQRTTEINEICERLKKQL